MQGKRSLSEISRKNCTVCKKLLPTDSFYKHTKVKSGIRSECKTCSKKYTNRNSFSNCRICGKLYQKKQQSVTCSKECAKLNDKKVKARVVKEWSEKFPEKRSLGRQKRRTHKQAAEIYWADQEEIKNIYYKAKELSRTTGIQHHVDHIIPLINENVCGLHWEENLQILTNTENLRKNNRFDGTYDNNSWRKS